MTYIYHFASPVGDITMAGNGEALTGLWFDGQKRFASTITQPCEERKLPVFEEAVRWLELYFQGKNPEFMPPLSMNGTPFQREVWEILLSIPYGQTMTYGEIADRIAKQRGIFRMSAQAVGGAVGRNPISIIVPCHRVIGTNGSMTGYAGGVERKEKLLRLEGISIE